MAAEATLHVWRAFTLGVACDELVLVTALIVDFTGVALTVAFQETSNDASSSVAAAAARHLGRQVDESIARPRANISSMFGLAMTQPANPDSRHGARSTAPAMPPASTTRTRNSYEY